MDDRHRRERLAPYKTRDMGCAAALQVLGFPIRKLDAFDPRNMVFVFDNTPEVIEAINGYFFDSISVAPLKFNNALKSLRARVYDLKKV